MDHPARPNHRLRTSLAIAALAVGPLLAACSSTDEPAAPTTSSAPGATGTAPGTIVELSDEERLAEAKTVAVGFFEAQAVNDYDRALERSDEAAALTIEWARAVNAIAAADESGYQVPAVASPNVRVQIDQLTADGPGAWSATGFVELSFRPGPVASTTTVAGAPDTTSATSPSTYVVDLRFVGEGADLRLADYRLDDLPYPVSQLFMAIETPEQEAGGLTGRTVLGHRDLDGSVQYVVALEAADADADPSGWTSVFTPAPDGTPPGTAPLPVGADSVDGTTFVDPIAADASGNALVVFPGAFPGSAGTLTVETDGATVSPTTAASPPGSTPTTSMSWALPDYPELTPRPVNTVDASTTTTSSSTTTSSTTTTTEAPDQSSTTAPTTTTPTTVTTTRPTPTTTAPSSTTTSTATG